MRRRLITAAAASLLLASCASNAPPPPPSMGAAPPPPPAAPPVAMASFDGVYKGQATLTRNGAGHCYAQSQPVRIRVANNMFRERWGSSWVESTIGPDGTINGSQGHTIVAGNVSGPHMTYTIGTQECQLSVAADKS